MPFTSAAAEALAKYSKTVTYLLELRTNTPGGDEWQPYSFEDFSLTHEARSPALLKVHLTNDALDFSSGPDSDVRTQLFAEARLVCSIGAESETLFRGRIFRVEPRDFSFVIYAQDWLALANDCECLVDLAPAETAEIAPARALELVGGGVFGSVFGFVYGGAGDPAFNMDTNPGSRRRSWAAGNIRLWYDNLASEEVPPRHYQINLTSGTATILEDTAGRDYFVTGVRCYIEGSLDWSEVFAAALAFDSAAGGMGIAALQIDAPSTGLDLAAPIHFQGRVAELLRQIERSQQDNLRLYYDSRTDSFKLRVINQKPAGLEDFALSHPQSIAQPRDIRDVYSRVVITGLSERPRNALTLDTTVISDATTAGDWFSWDGLNVGADDDFEVIAPLSWDGDANRGASVHNLAESEGGGTNKYDSWYGFFEADLGEIQRLTRLRFITPGSRNLNAQAGHQGMFWPGLQLLGSQDGTDYRLISAHSYGRFPPHTSVDILKEDILFPRLRYLRVLLGAYKHGFENQNDPSIGLAELELYTEEEYTVVKEIDGAADPPSLYEYTADYNHDGVVDSWPRNHPALWQRLGGRHRSLFENQAGELNEFLAHDRAIDLLAESVRLFQQVSYLAVCDPRIELYATVAVNDEINGGCSMLVEKFVLSPRGTEVAGTNYLASPLGSP